MIDKSERVLIEIPLLDSENLELFLSQVEPQLPDDKGFACWLWTGKVLGSTSDYGFFQGKNGFKGWCTQLSYVNFIGPIPINEATGRRLSLDHLCYITNCCHPLHLVPKTQSENVLAQRPRKPRKVRTHCRKGHLYAPETTRMSPLGFRYCGICEDIRKQKVPKEDVEE